MQRAQQIEATIMATLLVASIVGAVATLGGGIGLAGAAHPDDAEDLTDQANFTVNFPHATDHYPGDMNEENGSIEYFASGADAFEEVGAEEGIYVDYIIVHAETRGEDWIDYSACDTDNTEVFGIDRGNNNSGNQVDEDLLDRQKSNDFRDDGIVVEFFEFNDFGGDPPYLAPEDAIVAAQGDGSASGPCLDVTDEPGWYQIEGFTNGTVADNGPNEEPSEDAEHVELQLNSNWLYVCDCENEEEAREELGPPPNEQDDEEEDETTPTPTPTPEPEDEQEEEEATPTPTPETEDEQEEEQEEEATPTPTPETEDEQEEQEEEQQEAEEEEAADDEDIGQTPTPGDGPGFGALAALSALLAAALLATRRR